MILGDSITKVRKLFRDWNKDIFSDAELIRIYNEVMMSFIRETSILETYTAMPVPPTQGTILTFRWEEDYGGKHGNFFYPFNQPYVATQPWEYASSIGVEPQATGGYTSSFAWESVYANLQHRIRHYFPGNFIEALFMAHNERPMEWEFRSNIEKGNTAFKTKTGVYPIAYIEDSESNSFYLYPKVDGTYGAVDMDSDFGTVVYDEDDNLNPDSDYGVIVKVSGENLVGNYGVVILYQTLDDALYLIYLYLPEKFTSLSQKIELQRWMVKYIEFGVLTRLFQAETDFQNEQLGKYFHARYTAGVEIAGIVKSKRRDMIRYKLSSVGYGTSQRRLANLPSQYPSIYRRS